MVGSDLKYLTIKDRYNMREIFISMMEDVPDGKVIKVRKELLEDLLFEKMSYEDNGVEKWFKIPVISGSFLKKIDLSEISFENVFWSFNFGVIDFRIGNSDVYEEEKGLPIDFSLDEDRKKFIKKVKKIVRHNVFNFCVDYSHINKEIDLSKSFDAMQKNNGNLFLEGCHFSGNKIIFPSYFDGEEWLQIHIKNCKLNDCHFFGHLPTTVIRAYDTDFENTKLSARITYVGEYGRSGSLDNDIFNDCNLRNTELRIYTTKGVKSCRCVENKFQNEWVGCYVNDVYIKTSEEKANTKKLALKEYKSRSKNIIGSISKEISGVIGNI